MDVPLDEQLDRALAEGVVEACLTAEEVAGVPRGVLLALAAHESGLSCDGPRGLFGIDESRHGEWFAQRQAPAVYGDAAFVAGLIAGAEVFGQANGVGDQEILGFAVTTYRAGPGAALARHGRGDPEPESATASYADAVLARLPSVRRWLDARLGPPPRPRLEPGSSGEAVVELKRLLRGWHASQNLPPPRRMRQQSGAAAGN